ncbi:MAG: single-stranded-DNA-specific exonuclease RecJ [Clostridia bacterium]|nr:single-stranded-DNA-specific exonuclease RecJ [Clostridia bacterium]
MGRKIWQKSAGDKDRAAEIAEEFCFEPLAALLLTARGITDSDDVDRFLFEEDLFIDPFLITDIDRAVERIGRAIDGFEKIMIFGDYDADGVTSTALMYLYLSSRGADVDYYIPDRVSEGYGISCESIRRFKEEGIRLIITVDNGINAVEETELANELGIDVVITDHHKVGSTLPPAVAVVNPHREGCDCGFEDYAGVGVAFKLCCALEGDSDTILNEFADLAAIGTLADVVPLVSENRIIVKKGIELINRDPRLGIAALTESAGVRGKSFNSSSVSFALAPRINAAGRMKSASLAMKLLLADSLDAAQEAADALESANRERHDVENKTTQQAIELIEADDEIKYAPIIVVAGENWHQGVIGIVASRLVSKYGKPAIVISLSDGEGKGSCRSIEGFSIYDALSSVSDMLIHFGGHTLAAGFGIREGDISTFRKKLSDYCSQREMPFPTVKVDFNIKPSFITNELLLILGLFEPYGAENPQPCFSIKSATLKSIKPIGEGKHLRLGFTKDSADVSAVMFSTTAEGFPYAVGDTVDIAFKVEKNEFRGEIHPSVQIIDIVYSDFDFYKCESSVRVYEKYRGRFPLNEKERNLLIPDRAFFAGVYKFFRLKKSFGFGVEDFCHQSGCPYSYAAKVLVCLDIMCELGLLTRDGSQYKIVENPERVELGSSEILKKLNGGE